MAFTEYNLGNNIEGVPLGNAFGDTDLSLKVATGRGATFKDKNGVALTNFPLTVELYNSDNIVTKREVLLVASVSGDILTITSRQYEACVQDDTAIPKEVTNDALDFGLSSVFVSVRKTARQEDNVKDEMLLKANDNEVVKLSGAQTINDVKTFSVSPVMPTAPQNDNSTNGATTGYVDRAILSGSSTEELVNEDFYMGQDGQTGKTTFPEPNITSAEADQTQNVGDVAGNTRVAVRVFGSGIVDNFIDCILGVGAGSPSTNLEFKLETDNAGQPSGTLANPNATDSLTTAEVLAGNLPTLGTTFVSGVTSSPDFSGSTSAITTNKTGFKIKPTKGIRITTIEKLTSATCTTCYITDSTGTTLYTQTFVGDIATFNVILRSGVDYYILFDSLGSSYNTVYKAFSFPFTLGDIEYTDGSLSSSAGENLKTITTEEIIYEDLGLTKGTPYRLVMNQTSDTVNGSNYFTIGFSNQQTSTRILSTYDGSSYGNISFQDNFDEIDLTFRNNTGFSLSSQGVGLTDKYPPTIDNVALFDNELETLDNFSSFLVTQGNLYNRTLQGNTSGYTRLYLMNKYDNNNYFGIYYEIEGDGVGGQNARLGYTVIKDGTEVESGTIGASLNITYNVKIVYDKTGGDISFYYRTGTRTQIGTTYNYVYIGSFSCLYSNIVSGAFGTAGDYTLSSDLFSISSQNYTSEFNTVGSTNFIYLNSGLFLDTVLSYTDASLSYKTKKPYILKSNYSIGTKALVGFDGINNNQSGMTPGAKQYLSDTPGEISETPGTNKFVVGEALNPNSLLYKSEGGIEVLDGTGQFQINNGQSVILDRKKKGLLLGTISIYARVSGVNQYANVDIVNGRFFGRKNDQNSSGVDRSVAIYDVSSFGLSYGVSTITYTITSFTDEGIVLTITTNVNTYTSIQKIVLN